MKIHTVHLVWLFTTLECKFEIFFLIEVEISRIYLCVYRDTDGQKEEQTDFIPVFVYDETLRNIVRTLNRLDQIRVEGQLKYKPVVDSTGKKQFKGYINANKIAKLTTFRKIIDVKAENISAER